MDEGLYALDSRTVARTCGVSERTARVWRQRGRWPAMARRLLALVVYGDMEPMGGRAWRGWRLTPSGFESPHGEPCELTSARTQYYERESHKEAQRALQRYRDGVPVIDRSELDRLQAAQDTAARAAHELARLFPQSAHSGARSDRSPAAAPDAAVRC